MIVLYSEENALLLWCIEIEYLYKLRKELKMTIATLKIENAKHSYDVEVSVYKDGKYYTSDNVSVEANSRTQAGSMVRKSGYDVRSVNMTG